MNPSVTTLIRLCLLKANPQDLPATRQFLLTTVVATFLVLYTGYQILIGGNPLFLAVAHTLVLGFGWVILLQVCRRMDRFTQSASALFGCTAILNIASLPILASGLDLSPEAGAAGPSGITSVVLVSLWIWEIAVTGRIIKETLEIRLPAAVGISILISFALQTVLVGIFGAGS